MKIIKKVEILQKDKKEKILRMSENGKLKGTNHDKKAKI